MKSVASTTSYLELLRLASPEAIVRDQCPRCAHDWADERASHGSGRWCRLQNRRRGQPTSALGGPLQSGAHWLRASGLSLQ
jgi:hypothetical protein